MTLGPISEALRDASEPTTARKLAHRVMTAQRRFKTLAVSRPQARRANDHPPAKPPVPLAGAYPPFGLNAHPHLIELPPIHRGRRQGRLFLAGAASERGGRHSGGGERVFSTRAWIYGRDLKSEHPCRNSADDRRGLAGRRQCTPR